MATHTSTATHGAQRASDEFGRWSLRLRRLAAAVPRPRSQPRAAGKPASADELDEAHWPAALASENASPAPGDWLFPSFFLCMAVAALPLVGARWTMGAGTLTWHAVEGVVLLALPVILPLPFLFAGCVVALALHPTSRTPAASGFFCVGLGIGLAALHAFA
ncbi:hypothetical protein [Variovorax soli]|uniref:Uncharacterized protein n=1 Tax=Variovorax soli TaxID=376815 RepID=A0ABU1NDT2_9BURK|nr:hypothetical protein [Variovorax soli]MDR6536619.1 hypothetical protein [Variovorax soli]